MRFAKAVVILGSVLSASPALAQGQCDPADFLKMESEVAELTDYLDYAKWSYSLTDRTSDNSGSMSATIPIKNVPVSFSGQTASSMTKMIRTQSGVTLSRDMRRYFQSQRLSQIGALSYNNCLRSQQGAWIEIADNAVESMNFGVTAHSGQPGDGRKLVVTVINGDPVRYGYKSKKEGNARILVMPFEAAAGLVLTITGRDTSKPTLITSEVRLPQGQGSASPFMMEIPASFGFRVVEEIVESPKLDFATRGDVTRTDCITANSDAGDLVPATAAWINTYTNRPIKFYSIAADNSERKVCGRMRANAGGGYDRVRVIGTLSVVKVKLERLDEASEDNFGLSSP
jgi:hypothetical protein